MNVTPEKDVWLREGRTVYTLMHHGWIKGEEQFRNRLYFNLQYDHKTVTAKEAEDAAAAIVKAISAHDKLVASLKELYSVLDSFGDMPDGLIAPSAWKGHKAEERLEAARAALAAAGEPV